MAPVHSSAVHREARAHPTLIVLDKRFGIALYYKAPVEPAH